MSNYLYGWRPDEVAHLEAQWDERDTETVTEFDARLGMELQKAPDSVRQKRIAMGFVTRRNQKRSS